MTVTLNAGLHTAIIVVEVVATIVFALSGAIEGARKRLDMVGVVVVSFLTAFGGGTLRDILLDRRPFFWVEHSNAIWLLLAVCLGATWVLRASHFKMTKRAMLWPDAVGLSLFAASGTQLAIAAHLPAIVAVVMGVVTAAFGGVLRDIVCNEIPYTFRDHRPYALCAAAGGVCVVLASYLGIDDTLALIVAATVASSLRLLSLALNWRLPAWEVNEEHD